MAPRSIMMVEAVAAALGDRADSDALVPPVDVGLEPEMAGYRTYARLLRRRPRRRSDLKPIENLPAEVLEMPREDQELWIQVFTAMVAATRDEEEARAVAKVMVQEKQRDRARRAQKEERETTMSVATKTLAELRQRLGLPATTSRAEVKAYVSDVVDSLPEEEGPNTKCARLLTEQRAAGKSTAEALAAVKAGHPGLIEAALAESRGLL